MAHELSHALQVAAAAFGITLGVVAIGIGVYVFGSFWLMGGHAAERHLGASTREILRELFWAAVTQPFLPLFYFVGARLGAKGSGVPIVFVHGYMQNRVGFVFLARALGRRGLGPLYGFNYPWFASIPANAARLDAFVARICERTQSKTVDLVCHSMGGLVAMEMMRREADAERLRVRRCVTIASPHAGVVWRGPIIGMDGASMRRGSKLLEAHRATKLAVPCLSVYSSHDNVVHPKQTSQLAARGGRDIEVDGVAHLAILFSEQVAAHVADFLLEPDAPAPAVLDAVAASTPEKGRGEAEADAAAESDMKISSSDPPAAQASGTLRDR